VFDPQIFPVTCLTGELFLNPVTGVNPADTTGIGLMEATSFISVMVLGVGFMILGTNKQKEH